MSLTHVTQASICPGLLFATDSFDYMFVRPSGHLLQFMCCEKWELCNHNFFNGRDIFHFYSFYLYIYWTTSATAAVAIITTTATSSDANENYGVVAAAVVGYEEKSFLIVLYNDLNGIFNGFKPVESIPFSCHNHRRQSVKIPWGEVTQQNKRDVGGKNPFWKCHNTLMFISKHCRY